MRRSADARTYRGAVTGRLALVAIAITAVLTATLTPVAAFADDTGSISGTVRNSNWDGLSGATVTLVDGGLDVVSTTTTDGSGLYYFAGVADGAYKVKFGKAGHVTEWWNSASSAYWAESVSVFGNEATDIDATLDDGATISGTVTATDGGAPIAGVSVYAIDNYGSCSEAVSDAAGSYCALATTDALGNYTFDTLAGSDYRLLFSADGYVDVYNGGGTYRYTAPLIYVSTGGSSTSNNVTLAADASISGTVTAAGGVPVEEVYVNVSDTAGTFIRSATTDASGNYAIGDLLPGTYKVQFAANGYLTSYWGGTRLGNADHISLSAGEQIAGVSVILDRGASISGTISASGSPIANVQVQAIDSRGNSGGWATTGSDGRYTVSGLPAGSYTILASDWDGVATPCVVSTWFGGAATESAASFFQVVSHGATVSKNLTMTRCGTVSGTVTGAGSPAVALDNVTLSFYDSSKEFYEQTVTDEFGHYAINLRPGTYYIQAAPYASTYAPKWNGGGTLISSASAVVVAATSAVTTNFLLPVGGKLTGNIKDSSGANVTDGYVTAFGQNPNSSFNAPTDESGNYSLVGLPADTYKIQFSGGYFSGLAPTWWNNAATQAAATGVAVALGSTVTGKNAVLQVGASISGQVTSSSGAPAQYVQVAAVTSTGEQLRITSTDSNGNFSLGSVRAGSVTLTFTSYSYYGNEVVQWWNNKSSLATATFFTVAAGTEYAGKNAVLALGTSSTTGSISGKLTDPEGDDLDSISVGAFKQTGSSYELITWALSDGDGNYYLPGLAAGSYRLGFSDYGTGASFASNEGVEFRTEFWNDKTSLAAADPIALAASGDVSGKNAQLSYVGSLYTLSSTPTPTIAGTQTPGQTLSAVPGTWGPSPVTLTYQWQSDGADIVGKTGSVYPVTAADLGHVLSVSVTGTKAGYTPVTKTSLATPPITGVLTAPVPTITGTGAVGQTLTAVPGAWGPAAVELSYQWLRNGEAVSGETGSTYALTSDDAGKTITVTVSGTKLNYTSQSRTSVGKAVGSVLGTSSPTFTGIPTVGKPQTAVAGTWGPAPVTLAYQWNRAGTPILGAVSAVYLPTTVDSGKALSVTVTGTKTGYTTVSLTSGSVIIGNAFTTAPVPTISGTPTAGTELTASVGLWTPAPVTLSYQWLKNGSPIAGETGTTYTPTTADAASSITFAVTGTKLGFTPVTATSAAKVIGLPFSDIGVPSISGQNTVGQVLTADPGVWGPDPVAFGYQWSRAGVAIAGATAQSYAAVAADGGKQLTVTVTGSKASYFSVAVTSAPTLVNFALTTVAPTVTGIPTVGQRLTAVPGAWAPAPVVLAYQWYRDGTPIAGATATSYLLTLTDSGTTVSVRVTGTKAGYTSVTRSNEGSLIGAALGTPPVPTITGVPAIGSTLTAVAGTWTPAPVDLAYQWKRAGVAIAGATAAEYTLVAADLAKAITVTVTGSKPGYTPASATSAATTAASALTATPVPTVTGVPAVGSTLTAVAGTWTPAPVTLSYKWLRNGVAITGAVAATYKLVTADAGQLVTVTVTGAKTGYAPIAQTSTDTLVQSLLTPAIPTITGTATVNDLLSAVTGEWGPAPVELSFQWKRAGVAISGATEQDYLLATADIGKAITVTVTGTKEGFTTASATSAAKTVNNVLAATPVPTITGTPAVGSTLTAVAGTWTPAPVVLSYTWLRNGVAITGATLATYKLVAADAGQAITVAVTGAKAGYASVVQTSADTAIQSLLSTATPVITGVPTVGETLAVNAGTWGPDPVDLTVQWKRAGVAIVGATFESYTLVAADLAKAITVTVTGTKDGYTTASTTSAASTIGSALTATPTPTITGTPAVGSTLTAVAGTWTPAPVTLAYKWLRNGVAITGATASTYKPVTADAGQLITVAVTGTKAGYTTVATTSASLPIQSLLTAPVATIAGTSTVFYTLSAVTGEWGPAPVDLTFQWKRAGVVIPGATEQDYLLVTADIGKAITVTVTGTKEGYTPASVTSAAKTVSNLLTDPPTPSVTGTLAVGSTLTAATSAWTPAPVVLSYKWMRNGVAITGATAATYKLVTADAGQLITLVVTGAKAGYATASRSSSDLLIQSLLTAPVPTVSGTGTVGDSLSAVTGAWGPDPVDLMFQWKRAGVAIVGATEQDYLLITADIGKAITVTVTGTKDGYTTASATSAAKTVNNVLTATPVPTIAGTPAVGSTLTAAAGTWTPAPVVLSYKWLRNGVAITGATAVTYKLVTADAGQAITVAVTGTKAGFASVVQTSADYEVQSLLAAPVPTLSGTGTVGDQLTVVTGEWGPAPVELSFQWKRAGVAISGATEQGYLLAAADIGKAITVTVTGTKDGFTTASTTSVAMTVNNVLTATPTPTVSGTPAVGSTLTAAAGVWAPATVTLSYKWLRNGVAIAGATAATYKLVTADAGQTITIAVTGAKAGYASVAQTSADIEVQSLLTAPVPTLSGTGTVGDELSAVTGEWGPAPVDLSFQWKRAGVAISGATGQDYLLVTADIGKAITVTVTGAKDGYTTASTTSVAKTVNNLLTATPVPTVSGTPAVGFTLTAAAGLWTPATVALSYKWLRNGVAITGATAATYKLVTADAGQAITVSVTGVKAGFATVVRTSADFEVQSLLTGSIPSIAGVAAVGETVAASTGAWSIDSEDLTFQWKRAGVAISGATDSTYLLAAADAGQAITVVVTGTQFGYTPLSLTSSAVLPYASAPLPTVTGATTIGSVLTAVSGTWAAAPVTLKYQWTRDGVAIAGATAVTYTLVAADLNADIGVTVTGSKSGYATVSRSSSALLALYGLIAAPRPSIFGDAFAGGTLTANYGEWGPTTVSLEFQWFADGVPIEGATDTTYVVAAPEGTSITVRVTGSKASYLTVSKTSPAVLTGPSAP